MTLDVTDLTFDDEAVKVSDERPVVVDLWAPWCGPCRTLGPIIEKVVEETDGAVKLVKVNVDENPQLSAAFQVQSIPAVYCLKDRKVVDGFVGALPETAVREFIGRISPQESEQDRLVALGDEESLRGALEIEPDHVGAVTALSSILVERGENDEALALLARIPETGESRRVAALARLGRGDGATQLDDDALKERLKDLLTQVKDNEAARQEYLDVIESLEPDDPRRDHFRRALSAQLF